MGCDRQRATQVAGRLPGAGERLEARLRGLAQDPRGAERSENGWAIFNLPVKTLHLTPCAFRDEDLAE